MFCLKYVISCLIWDKFGLCMNKSQRVTVFAPFQDKGLYSLLREAQQLWV